MGENRWLARWPLETIVSYSHDSGGGDDECDDFGSLVEKRGTLSIGVKFMYIGITILQFVTSLGFAESRVSERQLHLRLGLSC